MQIKIHHNGQVFEYDIDHNFSTATRSEKPAQHADTGSGDEALVTTARTEPETQDETNKTADQEDFEPDLGFETALDMDKHGESRDDALDSEKTTEPVPDENDNEDKTIGDTDDSDEVNEQLVLEIITSLVDDMPDGVVYDEVQARAAEQGLESAEVEEHIAALIEKGVIYEPTIGVFKAV